MKRWKRMIAVSLSLCLALSVTGCGSSPKQQEGESKTDEKMEFTLYYGLMRDQMEPIIEAFQSKYPNVKVNSFRASSEELAATMEMEIRADNPQFDMVLVANSAIADIQEEYDPFATFVPEERDAIMEGLLDENNIQTPIGTGFYVIVYNTNQISADEAPQSWADLLDEKWKNKIAVADPKSSTSVYGFVWYITQYLQGEPYGWEYFEKLQELNPNYVSSHGTIGELVSLGECSLGVQVMATVQSSMAKGDPVNWVFPSDGMPSELVVTTIRKDTPNQQAVELFNNFLLSEEGQELVSKHLGYIPVRTDMDYQFENGMGLSDIELIKRDVDWISENKEDIIERFRLIAE